MRGLAIPSTIAAAARFDLVPNSDSSALPAGLLALFRDHLVLAVVRILPALHPDVDAPGSQGLG